MIQRNDDDIDDDYDINDNDNVTNVSFNSRELVYMSQVSKGWGSIPERKDHSRRHV